MTPDASPDRDFASHSPRLMPRRPVTCSSAGAALMAFALACAGASAQDAPKLQDQLKLPAADKLPKLELPSAPAPPKAAMPAAPKDLPSPAPPAAPDLNVPADFPGAASGGDAPSSGNDSSIKFTDRLPPELWSQQAQDQALREQQEDSAELTIQQIVNPEVVTASNSAESSLSAPAWVITITHQDLIDRGYTELDQVLDDLPSMDVVRPYGDTYLKDYWRGYRNNIGSPFLLMVDGVIYNQLWLNEVWIMTSFPISNVDRIEVMYGPASAIYGPNAAMGVINIITVKDSANQGAGLHARMTTGTPTQLKADNLTKIADGQALYKGDGFRVSASAHLEAGVLDPSIGENFEYTRDRYYRDPSLWGMASNYPGLADGFRSRKDKLGVDLRAFFGRHPSCSNPSLQAAPSSALGHCTELAFSHYTLTTGYGTVYPADRVQTASPWTYLEQSLYARHTQDLTTHLTSQTMFRYRTSNIDQPSFLFERAPDTGSVSASYWESVNHSWSFTQDFTIDAGHRLIFDDDQLGISAGLKYERFDMDRSYLISQLMLGGMSPDGAAFPSGTPDGFPVPPDDSPHVQNRSLIDTGGAYVTSRYKFLRNHTLHLGLRLDYSAQMHRAEPIFRAGYVGQLTRDLTVKLLFGQALQLPPFRELFGLMGASSTVSGSSSSLKAERSNTVEISADYAQKVIGARVGAYYVGYTNPMVSGLSSVTNVGQRNVIGTDIGLNALIPVPFMRRLRAYAYYSAILLAKQSVPAGTPKSAIDMTPVAAGTVDDVGDLALHKMLFGATGEFNKHFVATIMGRFISTRDTVSSNPITSIPAYCVLDANLILRDVFATGLSIGLHATNLLNSVYFDPGIRSANSGNTPGTWNGTTWVGSQGGYNSELPQPGREIYLTLGLDL